MFQPKNIIIADDHPLFRHALLETLKTKFVHTTWLEAQNVEELEAQVKATPDADLLLLDLHIPGAHGFTNLINIRSHHSQIPVVIISAHEDDETMAKALEFGAAGFIPKSTPVDTIYQAIVEVLQGNSWVPEHFKEPEEVAEQDIANRIASLTNQQYKILMMFAQGMLNKQIAYDLNVSEATIKAHATAIFKKLNVRNRTQAVIAMNALELDNQFEQS